MPAISSNNVDQIVHRKIAYTMFADSKEYRHLRIRLLLLITHNPGSTGRWLKEHLGTHNADHYAHAIQAEDIESFGSVNIPRYRFKRKRIVEAQSPICGQRYNEYKRWEREQKKSNASESWMRL